MAKGERVARREPRPPADPERRIAFRFGLSAESRAAAYLIAKGYRILFRRFKTPVGEIDIVARRGRVVAAIEVKARASLDEAAEAVTPRQRRRVAQAFAQFLAGRPHLAGLDQRFDVMLVAPLRLPRHLANAWRLDD